MIRIYTTEHNPQIPSRETIRYEQVIDDCIRRFSLHCSRTSNWMHATCNTAGNTDTNSSSNNHTRYINTKTNVGFLNAWPYTDPSRDVES
jgi:hypothetical protein